MILHEASPEKASPAAWAQRREASIVQLTFISVTCNHQYDLLAAHCAKKKRVRAIARGADSGDLPRADDEVAVIG